MKIDLYHQSLLKDNIELNSAQEEILTALADLDNKINTYFNKGKKLLSSLRKPVAPQGMYLHGSFGTGKSMLVDLFFDNLEHKNKHKVHFHSFMLEIHDYLHKLKKAPKNKKNIDLLKYAAKYIAEQYQVLYIDELEISDIADAMIVGKLFRELLAQKVIILITSNFAPNQLYLDGLQRDSFLPFIELIQSKMHVLKIKSTHDYRKNKIKSVESTYYIYQEDMDSQRFILDSFIKLTNNSPAKNMILTIDSRELICPITALDCAVFSFDQLCRSPMASSDYIAICEEFNIIILSEIPELSSDEHNEARRFIHLIDTIYEFKKILLCSAKTDIDHIYKSGKWHFEFLRTASRLHEMQSKEYLEIL